MRKLSSPRGPLGFCLIPHAVAVHAASSPFDLNLAPGAAFSLPLASTVQPVGISIKPKLTGAKLHDHGLSYLVVRHMIN